VDDRIGDSNGRRGDQVHLIWIDLDLTSYQIITHLIACALHASRRDDLQLQTQVGKRKPLHLQQDH